MLSKLIPSWLVPHAVDIVFLSNFFSTPWHVWHVTGSISNDSRNHVVVGLIRPHLSSLNIFILGFQEVVTSFRDRLHQRLNIELFHLFSFLKEIVELLVGKLWHFSNCEWSCVNYLSFLKSIESKILVFCNSAFKIYVFHIKMIFPEIFFAQAQEHQNWRWNEWVLTERSIKVFKPVIITRGKAQCFHFRVKSMPTSSFSLL